MKQLAIPAIIVAILAIVIAGYLITRNSNEVEKVSTSPTASAQASPSDGTKSSSANLTIDIANLAFATPILNVHVGDTVTWTNKDSMAHTVTSLENGPLSSGSLAKDATFSFTFTSAGTFPYKCNFHPSMTGTIVVE